jgi:SAM-dependent methyltransferase
VNGSAGPTAYDVAEHYDEAYYADLAERYTRRSRFARQRVANVLSLLPPLDGLRVVDIGCGMGTFAIECARRGAVALGVDPAPAALPVARRVAEVEGVRSARFVRADGVRLPLADGSMDLALAADVTEHLDDATLASLLSEAVRVLRPGGRLVLYTPSPTHVFERLRGCGLMRPDPSHIGLRRAEELVAAVRRAGLRVERVAYLPSHLPVWNWLERALGRWVGALRRRIGIVAVREAGR